MSRPPLPGGPYLVVGLARSGVAAMRALAPHGEVIGLDAGSPEEAAGLSGLEVHLRTDGTELLDRVRTVVKSPGVGSEAPVIVAARVRGLEVVGELELAWRLIPNEFVAVTGTNGKTTTVELLGAIHAAAGVPHAVAGNVGMPLASLVGTLARDAVVICEASSFQLEDASQFAPECAVLLNLGEDHLDRHGTVERYRAAKLRLFANMRPDDVAVLPRDLAVDAPGRVVRFGGDRCDLCLSADTLSWRGQALLDAGDIRLRGAHNLENAMAAAAAALARGIEPEAVTRGLREFRGVAHRLEEVAERGGVVFVNDSKATNVESARAGIESFDGGVHAILGGSLKGGGFAGLRDAVVGHCSACYLIGAAAEPLADDLEGAAPLHRCDGLEAAVRAAASAADPGQVVLLSPACASYDSYRDYEERGEHFRALVEALEAPG